MRHEAINMPDKNNENIAAFAKLGRSVSLQLSKGDLGFQKLTESIFNQVVECVSVTCVRELVIIGGQFL